MSKIIKIFVVFSLIFSLYIYISNAETTNLYNDIVNETTEEEENTSTDESLDNSTTEETSLEESSPTTTSVNSNARINTMSSIPEANLGLNNVLCIILIAIGVLIVLLAIAILIRLK